MAGVPALCAGENSTSGKQSRRQRDIGGAHSAHLCHRAGEVGLVLVWQQGHHVGRGLSLQRTQPIEVAGLVAMEGLHEGTRGGMRG